MLENPGWYTAYTPYQAEIAQGRLETLLTFQQMVMDLTGMDFANASLLDEATAASEAMTLCRRANKKSTSEKFFVADDVHPQTLAVIRTRGQYQGFDVIVGPLEDAGQQEVFGALLQYPGTTGQVRDIEPIIKQVHQAGGLVAVATDLLALTLLKPPGEMEADVVLGSAQRFGVPMGFGGPHAAFFATRDKYKRSAPGRIIGVSKDRRGNTALRMAMQTREQHIRRDKATSNICTAQALLANMAAMYAIYHGPEGLTTIATRVYTMTHLLRSGLGKAGFDVVHEGFFDTVLVQFEGKSSRDKVVTFGQEVAVNLRIVGKDQIAVSLDETTTLEDVFLLIDVFNCNDNVDEDNEIDLSVDDGDNSGIPNGLERETDFLQHETFHRYRSETEMLRYLKRLENKDFSLTHGMIPLGSCTMKLNATVEMIPVSWPEFSDVHPFAPTNQTDGYVAMIDELESWLISITGYDAMSMQPNSGAQGEYAGLLAIVRYHQSIGEGHRKICLIPSSAHGTNPASATMMGLDVVVVKTDDDGNIDLVDLREKADQHADRLSSLMITYPSTHGVFEETVREACDIVHESRRAGLYGRRQHECFGGIGGTGRIGLGRFSLESAQDLLHSPRRRRAGHGANRRESSSREVSSRACCRAEAVMGIQRVRIRAFAVSAANYGSASILPISWAYINLMGGKG